MPTDPIAPGGQRPADYPVVLRVTGQPCLVVGGGPVAARRAGGLLEVGGRITLVAPRVGVAVEEMIGAGQFGGNLVVERRPYRTGEAADYRFVVTATGDPDVDRLVVADATGAGIPVASADRTTPGSVQLPSVLRRGAVTVAVSTGGTSPAVASWLRRRIASAVPDHLSTMVTLVDEARAAMVAAGRPTEAVAWGSLLDEQVLPLLTDGRMEDARRVLLEACLPPDAH